MSKSVSTPKDQQSNHRASEHHKSESESGNINVNGELLFDSMHKPIPPIRGDIAIVDVEQDGQQYLYFHDDMHYATPNFALDRQVAGLLPFFDGSKTVMQISEQIGNLSIFWNLFNCWIVTGFSFPIIFGIFPRRRRLILRKNRSARLPVSTAPIRPNRRK